MCGVDMILGTDSFGSGDFVVEINPRLTTSYLGLRAACRDNLASAMLSAANGDNVTLSFSEENIAFSCSEVANFAPKSNP